MTTRAQAPLVDLDEMAQWILHETDDLLVFNKPGWLVCHPSKNGPLSSLVGAAREYTGLEKLHLVARLDRERAGGVRQAPSGGAQVPDGNPGEDCKKGLLSDP